MTTPLGKNTAWADKLLLTITWDIDCSQSFLRSSRSNALRYGRPSWVSVKYTLGEWDRHPFKPRRPPPWYIWNQDGCRTGKRSILTILRKNRGLWTVYLSQWKQRRVWPTFFNPLFYQQAFNSRWREKQVCYSFFYGFLPSCLFALVKKSLLAHEIKLTWREQQ